MKKPLTEENIREIYFTNQREEMVDFIPPECSNILDVGCSEGGFGKSIKNSRKAIVWGIELNENAADIAATVIDKVISGDFLSVIRELPAGYFDCIVFNDVLEHMTEPEKVLEACKPLLTSKGYVVSSIPNVRYIGNLVELLFRKDWEYKSGGILDRTHYRFFTQKSILRLFKISGFQIITCTGINPTNSWKTWLLGIFTFGYFSDVKFLEFATVAKISNNK